VLASTLQRLPVEHRPNLAQALAERAEDANDHNLPLMVWYGLIAVAEEAPEELVDVASSCRLPTTLRLISRCLAEQIESQPSVIDQLLEIAISSKERRRTILQGMSEGLKGWRRATKPANWDRVVGIGEDDTAALVTELSVVFGDGRAMDDLRRLVLGQDQADTSLRLAALNTLIQSRPNDLRAICESLLADNQVNFLAARGLSTFDDPKIGPMLVSRYNRFRGPYRPQVISILASRLSFAGALVDAIEEGKIPREDLTAYQVRQIKGFGDEALNRRLGEAWGEVRDTPEARLAQIESLKRQFKEPADLDKRRGRALFARLCQNCHRLYGEGAQVGPDLTGGNRSNLDYLLSNLVDPSSVVDKDYRMSVLLLDDDRILNGLVIEESERTITLQTATEKLTLDKNDIQSRKVTEKSPMPDGLLDSLTLAEIKDLIAYLQHPTQVPLPAADSLPPSPTGD
jgi:putative heme-binding domain-containing protein